MSLPADHSLQEAIRDFEGSLTLDQHREFLAVKAVPDASAVITFTAQLDAQKAKRGTCGVSGRLYTILQSIQQFSSVVDTFVQSNPGIAALVWGSVKCTMLIASNFTSYFDKLSALFMSFSKLCPRFEEYHILYPQSSRLQRALCDFHASVIRCCKQALQVIERTCGAQLINALQNSFKTEFAQFEADVRRCGKDVKEEILLANAQAANEDRQLQLHEQQAASTHRNAAKDFFRTVNKENKDSQYWRLQANERKLRKRRQHLLDSLSTYDHHAAFKQARKKRHANTAEWFTQTSEFNRWTGGPGGVLWCSGKLGSGKTILTSHVVDYLFLDKKKLGVCISFFFCRFDEALSLNAETILRSIIRQTFDADNFPKDVQQYLEAVTGTTSSPIEKLKILLERRIATFQTYYIIIDALDECEKSERDVVLDFLQSIKTPPSSAVRIFLTSRHGIEREIEKRFPSRRHLSMGCTEAQSDIVTYIHEAIAQRRENEDLVVGDHELIKEIQEALIHGAQGMFLWVAFQLDDVCSQCNDGDIREALRNLPKNLPETFNRALTRVHANGKAGIAKQIFRWLATAKRPLSLEELREAIAVEPEQPYSKPDRLVNGMRRIPAWCENLVILDEEDEAVQFAHHTVKKFVLGDASDQITEAFHFELSDADHEVGEICVTYLNFNDFKTQMIKRPDAQPPIRPGAIIWTALGHRYKVNSMVSLLSSIVARRSAKVGDVDVMKNLLSHSGDSDERSEEELLHRKHPFLVYASEYWLSHTTTFKDGKSKTWNPWKRMLLDEQSLGQTPWTHEQFLKCHSDVGQWIRDEHHLALLRLIGSSKNLFLEKERDCLIDEIMGKGIPVLLEVSWNEGYISQRRRRWQLRLAAYAGLLDMVEQVLNLARSVHGDLNRDAFEDALKAAAKKGHLGIVSRLLEERAFNEPYAYKHEEWIPLRLASANGHLNIVDLLLQKRGRLGYGVSFANGGGFALVAAAQGGHLGVVTRLIAEGAKINLDERLDEGRTALNAAVEGGHREIVESLLEAGADVNASDMDEQTALQAAVKGGHHEIVDRLLNEGADVNAVINARHLTALQIAASSGFVEIVNSLLLAGAKFERVGHEDSDALLLAAAAGHVQVVDRLLVAGADARDKDVTGRSAIVSAAGYGHIEVVDRLLAAGANVRDRDNIRQTGLTLAAAAGHVEVVKTLLDAGADVRDKNFRGSTALILAAAAGHVEVVKTLLDAGADVRDKSRNGDTALRIATQNVKPEVAVVLRAAGARE